MQSHLSKFEAIELREQAVSIVSAVTPVWSDTKKTVLRAIRALLSRAQVPRSLSLTR